MGYASDVAKISLAGILSVVLVSLIAFGASRLFPAEPVLYFILWAFVLIPVALMIVGALGARAGYYACMGPNRSVITAVIVSLISALGGIALWLLAGPVTGSQDFVSLYLENLDARGYIELAFLLVVYAVSGTIGGIVDYFISKGRQCEIRPGGGKP
jgi:hypothetical protein